MSASLTFIHSPGQITMKLYQLIYVSKSNTRMSRVELNEIMKDEHQNNRNQDITGILVYDRGYFFQAIEGEYNKIESVFARIQQDKQHSKVNRIISYSIQDRFFKNWKAGLYNLDETMEFDFYNLKRYMKLLHDSTTINKKHLLAKYALKVFIGFKEDSKSQPGDLIGTHTNDF